MNVIGIIPARFASTRFPGKPLADIAGKPMIQRVYEQCLKSKKLNQIIIATDHSKIKSVAEDFGASVILTAEDHPNGTSRCFEAIQKLPTKTDVIVNIQGDEPFIDPKQIDSLVMMFEKKEVEIATLIQPIHDAEKFNNPNVVKAVISSSNRVMLFSRSPIPHPFNKRGDSIFESKIIFAHIGIYAYRRDVLKKLSELPACTLEKFEGLEQLRWLYHNFSVYAAVSHSENYSVDVPMDIDTINRLITNKIIQT